RSRNLAWALPEGLGRGPKRHARPFPPAVYVLTGQMATHGSVALPYPRPAASCCIAGAGPPSQRRARPTRTVPDDPPRDAKGVLQPRSPLRKWKRAASCNIAQQCEIGKFQAFDATGNGSAFLASKCIATDDPAS